MQNKHKYKYFTTILAAVAIPFLAAGQSANPLGIDGGEHTSVGIYIKDLKADTVVYSHCHDIVLVPASVTKAVTSAAALLRLGTDYRFTTEVTLRGVRDSIDTETFHGNLEIKGVGDPTLSSSHFKDYDGFCDSIAYRLNAAGIKRLDGCISAIDDMLDAGPVPQWEIDDVAWPYGAGIHGINYRDNTFTLKPLSGVTTPVVPDLKTTVITNQGGTDLVRGIWSDHLWIFTNGKPTSKTTIGSTTPNPAKVLVQELRSTLATNGISVSDKPREIDRENKIAVYSHKSPAMVEILRSLMFRSDNMMAEGVLRALCPGGTRDQALDNEKSVLSEIGISTRYVTIKDGSGLSRVNRISAKFLGELLSKMSRHECAATYLSLFPRAGRDGTVRNFMKKTSLEGRLALKSGSMNGVQCYAGYLLDDDDKPSHCVVVLVNGFFCSRNELRSAISKVLIENLTENK